MILSKAKKELKETIEQLTKEKLSFGDIVRHRRKELSLSQEKLGKCIGNGCRRATVNAWENDKAYPSVENLLKLSIILDISLDSLFENELSELRRGDSYDNA